MLVIVPLNYLSDFSRLLKMALISRGNELKIKWTNHCVLSANGNNNYVATSNNVIFTIKDRNHMPLQSRYQQKLTKNFQNFLVKGLKDQCIGMSIKHKLRQISKEIF